MSWYYPPGVSANDPRAPWNAPDTDTAEAHARRQVCGDDAELTAETLGEFIALVDGDRLPVVTKTALLRGPISSAELLKMIQEGVSQDLQQLEHTVAEEEDDE
jgi:hypothetical protein